MAQKSNILTAAQSALKQGGAVVNYQHYPWWWAASMGYTKLVIGITAALADTFSSGFFFLALFGLIAPGLADSDGAQGHWILAISMFFSLCFYLLAEAAMFMGSGHYETKAASNADEMHGGMKSKATHSGVNEFFTRYRVWISTAAMIYMFTTDFIGFYNIEWQYMNSSVKGALLSPAARFFIAAPINAAISFVLFFAALNMVLWGAQQVEYSQDEKIRRRRLILVSDGKAGLRPGMSTQNPTRQLSPGTPKQLPPGAKQSPAVNTSNVQTVRMPQTGSVADW